MSLHATYSYRAARTDGALETGAVEAPSREAASHLLTGRGLFPIEITVERDKEQRGLRIPLQDLALGLRMLATLLESGLSMSRSLEALGELAPDSWRAGLPAIREAVREGQSLAQALASSPFEIPPVVIGIVRAGEAGSGLGAAVKRAAELMEESAATRSAIRGALAYPLLLAGAGLASIALLVGIVLPRFAVILTDLGQSLPASTRLVLGAASTVRALALPALIGFAIVFVLWRAWTANDAGLEAWHEMLLSLPIVGSVRGAAATARGSASLSALLESGVAISVALIHAARATGDAAIKARLLKARELIVHGERIGRALEQTRAVTPTAVRLVRAGEETGRLAAMLAHAARIEGERASNIVKGAVKLLEPALILGFGGLVALVAAALLQAVYSVRPM